MDWLIFVFSRHVGVMKENKRGIRSGCRMDWFIKLYVVCCCQINLVGVVDEAVGSHQPTRS